MASESTTSNVMVSNEIAYFRKSGSMTNRGTINLPDGNTSRSYGEGYIGPNSIIHGTSLADTTEYKRCETAMKTFLGEDWEEDPEEETIITNANNIKVRLSPEEIKMQNIADAIIPEIVQLEYIETTGTQYIDLDYTTTADFGFEIDVAIKNGTGANLFGGSYGSSNPYFSLRENKCKYSYSAGTTFVTFSNTDYSNRHKYKFKKNGTTYEYSYDGNVLGTLSITHPVGVKLALFSFMDGTGVIRSDTTEVAKCIFYNFKIYEGDTIVHDFIPVKDSNDVACLYDKITDTYFYNAGTGTFIAGPEKGPLPATPIYNLQDNKSTSLAGLNWDGNDLVFNADTEFDTQIAQSALSNGYTIIINAYPTEIQNWRGIFGVAHGSPASGIVGIQPTDGSVLYRHYNQSNLNIASSYNINQWNLLIIRYKSSGNLLEIYKGSNLVTSTSCTFSPYGNIIVGKAGEVTDTRYYFKGKLNQFIIYDRALTDEEMNQVVDYIEEV